MRRTRNILPPTYLVIAIITLIAVHFLIPLRRVISFPWNLAGLIPLLIGIYFNLIADSVFKKLGTTVKPFEESTALITTGVFRISRHPMYLGMVLILIGLATLLGSLTPFIVVFIFPVFMEASFIRVEEKMMEDKFGKTYLDYKLKVRKWI
jgi:protein-S-isoprenylcysteine O-methyltransferase Ste14